MNEQAQAVVDSYMRDLKRELRALPRDRRKEILEDIEGHIDQSLGENGSATEADARTTLDQLGDPSEIAHDARERFGIRPTNFGWQEVAAVILLPVGVFMFGIGWIVGVILLWTSDAWTMREKLIGTFVPIGGLGLPITLIELELVSGGSSCSSVINQQTGATHTTCADSGTSAGAILITVGLALLVLLAIAVPIWLGLRARNRTA